MISIKTIPAPSIRKVRAKAVSDREIAEILKAYKQHPLGMTPEEDEFRISLAGQQEKLRFYGTKKSGSVHMEPLLPATYSNFQ